MFENQFWHEFFQEIRCVWKQPSRYQIRNFLLNKEYSKIQDEVKTRIADAKAIGLQCDGWSTVVRLMD